MYPDLDPEWAAKALCKGANDDTFFPEKTGLHHPEVKAAKRICRRCSVSEECLIDALETEDEAGIRGGMTPRERRKLALRVA